MLIEGGFRPLAATRVAIGTEGGGKGRRWRRAVLVRRLALTSQFVMGLRRLPGKATRQVHGGTPRLGPAGGLARSGHAATSSLELCTVTDCTESKDSQTCRTPAQRGRCCPGPRVRSAVRAGVGSDSRGSTAGRRGRGPCRRRPATGDRRPATGDDMLSTSGEPGAWTGGRAEPDVRRRCGRCRVPDVGFHPRARPDRRATGSEPCSCGCSNHGCARGTTRGPGFVTRSQWPSADRGLGSAEGRATSSWPRTHRAWRR